MKGKEGMPRGFVAPVVEGEGWRSVDAMVEVVGGGGRVCAVAVNMK
jgi:hypothetical protein